MRADVLQSRTEARRVAAIETLDSATQAALGQFFTPQRAAALIASMPRLPHAGVLRVLDPGAGVGSLTAALVARLVLESPGVSVEVVAVEIDEAVVPYLEDTLADCATACAAAGVPFTHTVVTGDWIDLTSPTSVQVGDDRLTTPFDIVIMNPPYKKLRAGSAPRRALSQRGVQCPNIYAAFLALGVQSLTDGGQLVAITPRSFANGAYFTQFRRFLLSQVCLDRLHVFESRSTVFSDTGVLQENVILTATRGEQQGKVVLSVSTSHHDAAVEKTVSYEEVVAVNDGGQFIRIPSSEGDAATTEIMMTLPSTLGDLGLKVSTGKVVEFRLLDNLKTGVERDCVPLVYPGNVRGGLIEHPRTIGKAQGFSVATDADRKLLMPAGHYVVIKRFSAKEERRRIVAAVWDPALNGNAAVAFENHVNVIHAHGAVMDQALARGLSLWLNSTLVDQHFRTFSGHTQVNAGDIKSLRFPSLEMLRGLGDQPSSALPDQGGIDALVREAIDATSVAA